MRTSKNSVEKILKGIFVNPSGTMELKIVELNTVTVTKRHKKTSSLLYFIPYPLFRGDSEEELGEETQENTYTRTYSYKYESTYSIEVPLYNNGGSQEDMDNVSSWLARLNNSLTLKSLKMKDIIQNIHIDSVDKHAEKQLKKLLNKYAQYYGTSASIIKSQAKNQLLSLIKKDLKIFVASLYAIVAGVFLAKQFIYLRKEGDPLFAEEHLNDVRKRLSKRLWLLLSQKEKDAIFEDNYNIFIEKLQGKLDGQLQELIGYEYDDTGKLIQKKKQLSLSSVLEEKIEGLFNSLTSVRSLILFVFDDLDTEHQAFLQDFIKYDTTLLSTLEDIREDMESGMSKEELLQDADDIPEFDPSAFYTLAGLNCECMN